ncbi:hypothetical protein A2935_03940 [Candidatus Wolfebacteria bacterium RIFCSPLOWO2_01_FULL_47_17b]|uniref:Uncharacterized protein n=1 Tax=Candidatus Wolfebacteria bacterium RIFCSPLOWO2_01_FULL_47_17b TaxID=1802558 RepID=A0A1F8DX87_9BACT|nr:MAG: hypothetical protein A2935_03940 [Candidatus Wolfebacteria bacterium RIFCSPLOWO2_01_FULL_47_17b]
MDSIKGPLYAWPSKIAYVLAVIAIVLTGMYYEYPGMALKTRILVIGVTLIIVHALFMIRGYFNARKVSQKFLSVPTLEDIPLGKYRLMDSVYIGETTKSNVVLVLENLKDSNGQILICSAKQEEVTKNNVTPKQNDVLVHKRVREEEFFEGDRVTIRDYHVLVQHQEPTTPES